MTAIRVGVLAPLTWPGLVPAGRDLLAGLELAVEDINAANLVGAELDLIVCNSRGERNEAVTAVEDLAAGDAVAVVGEFHSVVANRVAERVEQLELPFVCSSATLDALTARRSRFVFRIAPPQSYGWRVYSEFLASAGYRHVVLMIQPDIYWDSGASVIEAVLGHHNVRVSRVEAGPKSAEVVATLAAIDDGAAVDAVLLLVGYPLPVSSLVIELRSNARFGGLLIGDPAGRAAFGEWWDTIGADGVGVPYLAYLPECPTEFGQEVGARFSKRFGREPTFVAFEGYDTVLVLAQALAESGADRTALRDALERVHVEGTRGQVSFADGAGVEHHQWVWPPVRVIAAPFVGATPSQMETLFKPA